MKSDAEMRQAVRDWVKSSAKESLPADFTDETPILESRIITSMQIMDLILFLEALSGSPIDVEQLKPGAFRDVNAIVDRFCKHA